MTRKVPAAARRKLGKETAEAKRAERTVDNMRCVGSCGALNWRHNKLCHGHKPEPMARLTLSLRAQRAKRMRQEEQKEG